MNIRRKRREKRTKKRENKEKRKTILIVQASPSYLGGFDLQKVKKMTRSSLLRPSIPARYQIEQKFA